MHRNSNQIKLNQIKNSHYHMWKFPCGYSAVPTFANISATTLYVTLIWKFKLQKKYFLGQFALHNWLISYMKNYSYLRGIYDTCIHTGRYRIWWNLYWKFRWKFRQIKSRSVYKTYLTLLCTTPSWLIFIIFAILPPWLYILCLIKLAHMVSNTEIKGGWGAFWPGQGKLYNEVSP